MKAYLQKQLEKNVLNFFIISYIKFFNHLDMLSEPQRQTVREQC